MSGSHIFAFVAGAVVGIISTAIYYANRQEDFLDEIADQVEDLSHTVRGLSMVQDSKKQMYKRNKEITKKIYSMSKPVAKELAELEVPQHRDPRFEPAIISFEDYGVTYPDYETITISYYSEDDTLCDEEDEIIEDPDYVVGYDVLGTFGDDEGDPNVVYVRNHKLRIDYEIVRVHGTYTELVLGIGKE